MITAISNSLVLCRDDKGFVGILFSGGILFCLQYLGVWYYHRGVVQKCCIGWWIIFISSPHQTVGIILNIITKKMYFPISNESRNKRCNKKRYCDNISPCRTLHRKRQKELLAIQKYILIISGWLSSILPQTWQTKKRRLLQLIFGRPIKIKVSTLLQEYFWLIL